MLKFYGTVYILKTMPFRVGIQKETFKTKTTYNT